MLSQLCRLENFTDRTATISIRTAPSSQKSWVENLQEKLPNIEAAFQAALNLEVKVILIRASSTTSRNSLGRKVETRTNSPNFNNSTHSRKEALAAPPSTAIAPSPPKVEIEKATYQAAPTERSETKPSTPPLEPPILNHVQKTNKQEINDIIKDDAQVVTNAAQRLAEIFQGEIIPIPDELKISLFANKEQNLSVRNTEQTFTDFPEDDLENEDDF